MFQPGEIVYGFVSGLGFRKPKYTSQCYYGVPDEQVKHGAIVRNGEYFSYVFEKDVVIGVSPEDGSEFSFPLRTTVTFDYGINKGYIGNFAEAMQDIKTVCTLNKKEFGDLLYAMYKSPEMNNAYKPYLEKSLEALFNDSKN